MSHPPEPWTSKWGRRCISIPSYTLAFALLLASSPAWIPLLLVVDLALSRGRFPRVRTFAFFLVYLACELVGIAFAAGLWAVRLGGALGGARAYVLANAQLQRYWTGILFAGARRVLGFRLVVEEGSARVTDGPFLLFVRHTSTADTILAAVLVANPNGILLRYVLKRALLWDPCLDLVGRRLPNSFVVRGSTRRAAEIAAVAELATNLGPRDGALIYPEGTRFSEAKLRAAQSRLRSEGRRDLADVADTFRNVLPPRLGGPLALLDAAVGVDVVVLEHAGFEAAESFGQLWAGDLVGKTVFARMRRIPASEIPATDRERWLFEMWREMDEWVTSRATQPR